MFVAKLTNDSSGRIEGKENGRAYLAKGLAAYPGLRFRLLNVFAGVSSFTLQYASVNDLIAAEVFELNDQGLATCVQCHYTRKNGGNG